MIQLKLDDAGRKLAQDAFRRGKESDFRFVKLSVNFALVVGNVLIYCECPMVQVQAFADSELHEMRKKCFM